MTAIEHFLARLALQHAVLVTVRAHRGSVPREAPAWMAVFPDTQFGSIGGGHLELQAALEARQSMRDGAGPTNRHYALGPTLGQCCGGEVQLHFEPVGLSDVPRLRQEFAHWVSSLPAVALFGGGHVGRALVQVLGSLPLQVRWMDSRDEIFPSELPPNVHIEQSQPVQGAVATLAPQSHVLIMSFSHAEDLDIVASCLLRQCEQGDLPFIGLIGSKTKWARFCHRLQARGFSSTELARVTCPVGLAGIYGKEPEVIAVSVAAQLLQVISAHPLNQTKGCQQLGISTDHKDT